MALEQQQQLIYIESGNTVAKEHCPNICAIEYEPVILYRVLQFVYTLRRYCAYI